MKGYNSKRFYNPSCYPITSLLNIIGPLRLRLGYPGVKDNKSISWNLVFMISIFALLFFSISKLLLGSQGSHNSNSRLSSEWSALTSRCRAGASTTRRRSSWPSPGCRRRPCRRRWAQSSWTTASSKPAPANQSTRSGHVTTILICDWSGTARTSGSRWARRSSPWPCSPSSSPPRSEQSAS